MLVGLFKTIFFLVTFYYLFKIIGRFLLPLLLKKGVERMQQQQQRSTDFFREEAKQQEGKVTIKTKNTTKAHQDLSDNQGEYVDYEDVK
jgi:hypothetical protein